MENEIEAIRARYEADPYDRSQAVADRATLLRLLDAAREELAEMREAAGPFADISDEMTNWTDGTPVNLVLYHVGQPTHLKQAFRVRDIRRLAAALAKDATT